MGCHSLLQGLFPTQELNQHLLCFLHCRQILYPLRLWGIPPKNEDSVCKKESQAVLILYVQAFFSTIMICFSLDFKYLWIEEELPRPVYSPFPSSMGFPGGSNRKESACNTGDSGLIPQVRKIPRRRKRQLTLVLLPGKSRGQRSLGGYSLWDRKESDTAEQPNQRGGMAVRTEMVAACSWNWPLCRHFHLESRFSQCIPQSGWA